MVRRYVVSRQISRNSYTALRAGIVKAKIFRSRKLVISTRTQFGLRVLAGD